MKMRMNDEKLPNRVLFLAESEAVESILYLSKHSPLLLSWNFGLLKVSVLLPFRSFKSSLLNFAPF